jgi:outer membrane protein, heavy metal efflux system
LALEQGRSSARLGGIPGRFSLLAAALAALSLAPPTKAQGPTIEGTGAFQGGATGKTPGTTQSLLGPTPGVSGGRLGIQPGGDELLLGRLGTSTPRVPTAISTPGGVYQGPRAARAQSAPQPLPTPPVPFYGTYEMPKDEEVMVGPPDGLTLEQAIERLLAANPDLLSKQLEIPQARADVLTASLRGNPIFFADTQLVPYGVDSVRKPDGPTQYDINVSQPIDYVHKRKARVMVASRALQVQEAQFQNEVRLGIQNLYNAYVDVLAARQAVTYSEVSKNGLEDVLRTTIRLREENTATSADVDQARSDREIAVVGLLEARENLRRSTRALGELLKLSPPDINRLELRGTIQDVAPPLPPDNELYELALQCRPDVAAFRMGTTLAEANVMLQRRNRYQDAYFLFQPFTYQNNLPYGKESGASWAWGLTVPMPVFNRNQGNIERARINVSQSQVERESAERRAILEVEQALNEYRVSGEIARHIRQEIEPVSRKARDARFKLFTEGEAIIFDYLNAQRRYNDVVKAYLDAAVRHRRSMLGVNTAVGQRLLP